MNKPGLLLVSHLYGGGVEKHVLDLIELLRDVARVEWLRPDQQGNTWLRDADGDARCIGREDWSAIVEVLRQRHYERVHFHQVQGFPPQILQLASALGLPYDLTLHDYYPYCPQNSLVDKSENYCGEPDLAGCERCVAERPNAWAMTVAAWRAAMAPFILGAARVIAPTQFVAQRLLRHFPDATVSVRPHPPRVDWRSEPPQLVKVIVLGTLSRRKGFDIFVACAEAARDRGLPLSFCLLGYTEHVLPAADLPVQIRGEYADADLPKLVQLERADVIWMPTRFPETYSYVLDVALASGLPIVATRIGAIEERLTDHIGATLLPLDASADECNAALLLALRPEQPAAHDVAEFATPRSAYRDELLAPVLDAVRNKILVDVDSVTAIVATENVPYAAAAPDLVTLFANGVLCGHSESRVALGKRLAEIESDYAVLNRYEQINRAPWFDQLQELNSARVAQHDLKQQCTYLQRQIDEKNRGIHVLMEQGAAQQRQIVEQHDHIGKLDLEIEEKNRGIHVLMEQGTAQQRQIAEQRDHIVRLDLDIVEKNRGILVLMEQAADRERHIAEQRNHIATLDRQIGQQDLQIESLSRLNATQQQQIDQLDRRVAELDRELDTRNHWIGELQRELSEVRQQVDAAVQQIREYEGSTSWKLTQPLRTVAGFARDWSSGLARKRRVLQRGFTRLPVALRIWREEGPRALAGRIRQKLFPMKPVLPLLTAEEAAGIGPLALATCPDNRKPRTSIVIPVYGQHAFTFNCLRSLGTHTKLDDVEIIVVDDASPSPAAATLKDVQGVRFLRNRSNQGFIGSCHAGAAKARGEFIVLLNNDVQVTAGWLEALLSVFELRSDAGMVGARLVYPDGRLQEAGGIVWRDGSAWNWGRGQDPEFPPYRYLREADYCSGACLALRRADWAALGGFDRRYAPAYYEDTDLAFRVREAGKKVYYQPESVIIHFEGVSSGTDETTGIKRHQVVNRETFYNRWQPQLARHRLNAASPELEVDRGAKARVLVVEACMITPDQDSGSVRMLAMLELLVESGCKVSFIADNLEHTQPYVHILQQAGVEVWHGPYVASVEQLLVQRGAQYDVIVFCRHYIAAPYIDRVRQWAPRAKIVFDTVDLHFLREERLAQLEQSASLAATAAKTRKQELSVIAKADITLVVSPVEKKLLAELLPGKDVRILSNIHEPQPCDIGYTQRHGLLFVGGFQHPPNIDAVRWFVAEIWPLVRHEAPEIEVTIVGSKMPESLRALAGPGIDIKGFVPDIEPLLRTARISLAPLRYGAGVKGKMNQAMAWGIPVVATAVAAEGMELQDGRELLVADSAADFARAVLRLYRDEALWTRLSEAGRENVRKHFSRAAARDVLIGIIESD